MEQSSHLSRPLRVLHIEDSPDDGLMLQAELEAAGYSLVYRRVDTESGMVTALINDTWDVVLSDFSLSDLNAYKALRLLKISGQDLPLVVVSGFIGELEAVALMKAGAHDYVMKANLARLAPVIEREMKEAASRAQRRAADQALAANRKLLEDITRSLGEGLLVLDTESRLLLMNAEAERLLGWTQVELSQHSVHDAIHHFRPDGSPLPRKDCVVFRIAHQGQVCRAEDEVFVRKDGTVFPVSFVATPIIEDNAVIGIVIAFQDVSERKKAERELHESQLQLQELSAFLQQVREEERTRIARELHDELGQALTALRIDLNWLDRKLSQRDAAIGGKLAAMHKLVDSTVESVRRISEDLRPGMLDDLGLAAAIEHHVENFARQAGIRCTLNMNREHYELDDRTATTLFRVLQESLTNVARHANAGNVEVRLQDLPGEILLIVKDDGCGLPAHQAGARKTYGLLGMHERVKLLGGSLDISSEPGRGTRIEASLPLAADAPACSALRFETERPVS